MRLWIGWSGRESIFYLIIFVAMFFFSGAANIRFKLDKRDILLVVAYYIALIYTTNQVFAWGNLVRIVPIIGLLLLDEDDRYFCFYYITKWFALLMIISLAVYWLVQLGQIPSLGTIELGDEATADITDYSVRNNYIFYVYGTFYNIRFNGPFLEPGHLGMMCAFILFVNKFNLTNKYNLIILLALLHTYSLAGYVLAFIGFWMSRYYQGKLKLSRFFLYGFCFLGVFLFATYYNGGENFLNTLILDRLQLDDEKGFTGNNRSGEMMALLMADMVNDTHTLFWGYDTQTYDLIIGNFEGSGFTKFMVQRGLIGLVIVASIYLTYIFSNRNKKYSLLIFVFLVCMFWQRCYFMWHAWIICFTYGISIAEKELNDN